MGLEWTNAIAKTIHSSFFSSQEDILCFIAILYCLHYEFSYRHFKDYKNNIFLTHKI